MHGGKNGNTYLKRFLNYELKQRFLLNLYINVPDLFFDFCCAQTLQNFEKLDIAFCSSHIKIFSCITHKYVNTYSYSYHLQQYNLIFVKALMYVTPR